MNTVLAVLLLVLKIIGAVLLFVIALVLLVSLVPFGAQIDYRAGTLTVDAVLGPVRKRFLTRTLGQKKAKPAKTAPPPAPPSAAPGQTAGPAPAARGAAAAAVKEAPPAAPAPQKAKKAKKPKKEPEPAAPAAETASERPGLVDRLLAAVRRDPVLFIERVVTHALFAGGRLLSGVCITGLRVYWPVHTDEAAHTALLFADLLAALNNALVRLREQMTVRAEELWLEPDFTGELGPKRHIAATVTIRPIVLLVLAPRLAWRIWRDEAFAGVLPFTKAPQTEQIEKTAKTETKAS